MSDWLSKHFKILQMNDQLRQKPYHTCITGLITATANLALRRSFVAHAFFSASLFWRRSFVEQVFFGACHFGAGLFGTGLFGTGLLRRRSLVAQVFCDAGLLRRWSFVALIFCGADLLLRIYWGADFF